jgi:hypothetical protein
MRTAFIALLCSLACTPKADTASSAWNSPVPTDADTDTDLVITEDDGDADGYGPTEDCDDDDPEVHPGAVERCNGEDDDCDGAPHPGEVDADGVGGLDCALCDEGGYWSWIRDETDPEAMIDTLNALTGPISCSYSYATDFLFLELDKHSGEVECVYTGAIVPVGDDKPTDDIMNTEHSWPQSLGADEEPAKCDLHHLYPTVPDANSARGSYPFGEVTSGVTWSDGGSELGTDAGGQTVFEPRDEHKGDVARSMVYFAIRYQHTLSASEIALYQAWHAADPPSEGELARTFAIRDEQGHANPAVVCDQVMDAL